MRATVWNGKNKLQVENVPDPSILNARDAIVKISSTAICGSDLHIYNGYMPTMRAGDILGHEFMGEVVELGRDVKNLAIGDRVVVPFPIACGNCTSCLSGLYSVCENSNPNAKLAEKTMGYSPCGIFGYTHMMGGYPGGQAEYARVPFADVGPLKIESDLPDESVLFLSDIFPTGYMGAEVCDIQPGDVIAVWGAGPVGLFAAASAKLLGAERIIVIDRFDERLQLAAEKAGATDILNYEANDDVMETLREWTGGRGPDAVIDAVGLEGHHHHGFVHGFDKVRQANRTHFDRPHALREAILSVRNGGIVSVVGVYGGLIDKFPMNAVVNRSLTIKAGQCHVHRYMKPLLERIQRGEIDPGFVISHTLPLDEAPEGYRMFNDKLDNCTKVVLKP